MCFPCRLYISSQSMRCSSQSRVDPAVRKTARCVAHDAKTEHSLTLSFPPNVKDTPISSSQWSGINRDVRHFACMTWYRMLAQGDSYGDPNCVFPDADGNTNDGYAACLVRFCCLLSHHSCDLLSHMPITGDMGDMLAVYCTS